MNHINIMGGDPHINLALSILYAAKQDAKMWLEFKKDWGDNENVSSIHIAEWVIDWINNNQIYEACGLTPRAFRKMEEKVREIKKRQGVLF